MHLVDKDADTQLPHLLRLRLCHLTRQETQTQDAVGKDEAGSTGRNHPSACKVTVMVFTMVFHFIPQLFFLLLLFLLLLHKRTQGTALAKRQRADS